MTAPCFCRFCRRFDQHMEHEAGLARESIDAQLRGDFDDAARADALRVAALDAGLRCLEHCEREAPC